MKKISFNKLSRKSFYKNKKFKEISFVYNVPAKVGQHKIFQFHCCLMSSNANFKHQHSFVWNVS